MHNHFFHQEQNTSILSITITKVLFKKIIRICYINTLEQIVNIPNKQRNGASFILYEERHLDGEAFTLKREIIRIQLQLKTRPNRNNSLYF